MMIHNLLFANKKAYPAVSVVINLECEVWNIFCLLFGCVTKGAFNKETVSGRRERLKQASLVS